MPKVINQAMGKLLLNGTLTKVTRGSRTPGSLAEGPGKTTTAYTFKGFFEDYSEGSVDGALVKDGDRKVMMLADSLSSPVVPDIGDSITLEGQTRSIIRIKRDPAGATYVCQVR